MSNDTQVLIIGAGPTGLVLALYLTKLGVRVKIVDQADQAGTTSRALVVHARTLEFYRWLGLDQKVIERGHPANALRLWVRGQQVAHAAVGDLGRGLSPFPTLIFFPQDEHERLLIDELKKAGVEVERKKKLLDFLETENGITANLETPAGPENISADYIAGCDGAHSRSREILHTGFGGNTYAHVFYVADAEASGPAINGDLNIALDEADFLAVFPMKGKGRVRLIGTVEDEAESAPTREWKDVSHEAIKNLKVKVEKINWFSTYRVHHRVTDHYRKGRAFLLGDAAHIHSPVGGQGMNTGIGDAINLGWKLAEVLQGLASKEILSTYEVERIAFARRLVATTDRAFQLVISDGKLARFVRTKLVPVLVPILLKLPFTRRFMFRTVSQIGIHYRMSNLSEHGGGDRLPWVEFGNTDNFAGLDGMHWLGHWYGARSEDVEDFCREHGLKLQAFPWDSKMGRAGLEQDYLYLLRPDGHIAFKATLESFPELAAYLRRWGIRS